MTISSRIVVYKGYSIETRAFGAGKRKLASYRLIVSNVLFRPSFMKVLPDVYAEEDAAHVAAEEQAHARVDHLTRQDDGEVAER